MAVTLDTLKKTVGKKKAKSMAYAWLADYENMAGDSSTALARVDAGLQLYPGDIPGMLVRTKILFQQGNFEECIKECERVLEKEPFCLSAQKRMGDAYDKLENVDERNRCYRRVHDMDPLDTFWKEEYEAVSESAAGVAAVAGAVGEAVADSEFAMPDMEDIATENASETAEAVEETASTEAEPVEEKAEDSLFSKSFDMDIDAAPAEEAPAEETAKPYVSPFSAAADDDPFASLASLGSDDSLVDESAMDSLQQSLESAMDSDIADVSLDQEIPEGEEISGNDVGSAFSSLFGDEDELDTPDEGSTSASPFAQMDLPTSLDDDSEVTEEKPQSVFGDEAFGASEPAVEEEKVEDKPQSIDDAFGDIFGEDELPEELPASTPAPSAELPAESSPEEDSFSGGMFEKSAASDMGLGADDDLKLDEPAAEAPTLEEPVADKPQSLDSAFADIFGDDELPEELPAETSAQPAPQVEDALPADDALTLDDSLPADDVLTLDDTLQVEEDKPAEEKLDSLDGFDIANWSPDAKVDDSLDQKAEETLDIPAEPAVQEETLDVTLDAAEEIPAAVEEPVVEEKTENDELTLDETPEEPVVEEAAPEQVVTEETTPEQPVQEEAETEGFSVDKAFDALFAEDDELPEERPVDTQVAEVQPSDELAEAPAEAPAEEAPAEETLAEDTLAADNTDKLNIEPETVEVAEAPAEPVEENLEKDELDKEMGAAFDSLFAGDDDLEVEQKTEDVAAPAPTQEDTGAVIEEAPLEGVSLESDLDKSFSNLFGEDDSLEEETPVAEQPAPEPEAVAEEQPAVDAGSLESEFSGAFKQLFDTDDDSLDEKEDIPSNKGVDFLMSGDSDDEVSAGLVKDPTVPLDKMPTDLDESLNTPTLAEIYFEQGLYGKAIDIYQDLARKEPENETIRKRLEEIEAAYREKFGDGANG